MENQNESEYGHHGFVTTDQVLESVENQEILRFVRAVRLADSTRGHIPTILLCRVRPEEVAKQAFLGMKE